MAEPDDVDFGWDFIQRQQPDSAVASLFGDPDGDPKVAAKSVALSADTGVPAPVIYTDPERFQRQQMAKWASELVRENPHLQSFLTDDAMAPKIAKNDIANLDTASQAIGKLAKSRVQGLADDELLTRIVPAMWHGAVAGFGDEPMMQWMDTPPFQGLNPASKAAWTLLGYPVEAVFRTLNAGIKAASEGGRVTAEDAYYSVTGDRNEAQRFSRDIAGMVEAEAMGMSGRGHAPGRAEVQRGVTETVLGIKGKEFQEALREQKTVQQDAVWQFREELDKVRAWINGGEEPPPGVSPFIDKARINQSKEGVKALEDAGKESDATETKELSPETYKKFVQQHEAAGVEINADAVRKLYGDNVPAVDDGLLGHVVGIGDNLEASLAAGGDVTIPLHDWLGLEPDIRKTLIDDVRVQPGALTLNEIKDKAFEPLAAIREEPPKEGEVLLPTKPDVAADAKLLQTLTGRVRPEFIDTPEFRALSEEHDALAMQVVSAKFTNKNVAPQKVRIKELEAQMNTLLDREFGPIEAPRPRLEPQGPLPEPLPQVRAGAGLEPLFAIGDRSLKIEKSKTPSKFAREQLEKGVIPADEFHILDQDGRKIGTLQAAPFEGGKKVYIDNILAYESKGFGPNSLGPGLIRSLIAQIKAEYPNVEQIGGFRISGAREKAGTKREAWFNVKQMLDDPDIFRQLLSRITSETQPLGRLGGVADLWSRLPEDWKPHEHELAATIQRELARIAPKAETRVLTEAPEIKGRASLGVYFPSNDIIIVALDSDNPRGIARHEAIHHLVENGFFTNAEWDKLVEASKAEGWHEKFNINRYKEAGYSEAIQLEESIAEAYRAWANGKLEVKDPTLFQRLKEFFERLHAKVREILGRDFTWDEVFQKVESGEVGAREPMAGEGAQPLASIKPPELPQEGTTRMEDREPFRPGAMTPVMTADMQARYMKLIAERHKADEAATRTRAERFQKAQQTEQWKKDRQEMRVEVEKQINNRPDVAADLFFNRGELFGEPTGGRPKIDPASLTPELRERLEQSGWLKPGGMDAADAANLFGFRTSEEMFNALAEYQAQRPEGIGAKRQRDAIVEKETDRQMELRYGRLEDNIIAEAKDQAASETQLQLLHEETYFLASQANAEFSLTRDQMRTWAEDQFGKSTFADMTSAKWFQTSGKHGRAAEEALLKGKAAEAFAAKQQQYFAMSLAQQAIKLEKERAQFDKSIAKFRKREVKGIDREFTDFIQEMMLGSNIPLRVTMDEIQQSKLFHGNASLKEFAEQGLGRGWGLNAEISPELQNGMFKDIKTMTVNDFRDLKDAVDALAYTGRRVNKIFAQGRLQDKKAVVDSIIDNLLKRPKLDPDKEISNLHKLLAVTKRPEQIIKDLDDHAELGPAFRNLWEPMTVSSAKFLELEKQLTAKVQKMTSGNREWMKSLGENIPNDFFYDPHDGTLFNLNRGHLVRIMLNWGNEGNIKKFTEGWAAYDKPTKAQVADFRARMEELIQRNARPEDWQYVHDVWDIFSGWQSQLDTVHRNTSGKLPKWVRPDAIKLPDGSTISEGGYFPLIPDKTRLIPGTGFDPLPNIKNGVMQRDYFRPTTTKTHMMDRQVNARYRVSFLGDMGEVSLRMQQVMHDIAYRESMMDVSGLLADKRLRNAIKERYSPEYLKQLDAWLVRQANHLNYDEIAMSGMNSILQRVRQNLVAYALPLNLNVVLSPALALTHPGQWARTLWDYDSMRKLTEEHSRVVPHTEYNLDRDFREHIEALAQKKGWDRLRTEATKRAYYPMILLEQRLRTVTFYTEFKRAQERGLSDYDASQVADSAVRERHGAQTLTDLPTLMASNEGYKMMTVFMGYFNTMDNWARQIPGQVRREEYGKALATAWGAIIVPAIFGGMMFNKAKEDESYWKISAKAVALQMTQGIPFFREAASMAMEGYKPTTPLGSALDSIYQTGKDAYKYTQGKPVSNVIRHVAGAAGMGIGIPGTLQAGKTGQFMYDYSTGKQRPRDIIEWIRGLRTGEARLKKGS